MCLCGSIAVRNSVMVMGRPPREAERLRERPLLKSALLLMAAGAVTRAIGMVYRIVIVRWAGPEALGLFQMVMPVFRAASTMATFRLPVALTRLTADGLAKGDVEAVIKARRLTAVMITTLTVLTGVAVLAAAPFLANRYLTDPRTEKLILLLPLAFVPSALTGIFRGFAEGRQNMKSTAAGQVAEQLVRVPVVLVLLSQWAARGVEYLAAALVIGLGVGEIVGLITAIVLSGWWSLTREYGDPRRRRWRWPADGPRRLRRKPLWRRAVRPFFIVIDELQTARALFSVAMPLWLATMINTAAQMINVSLIPRRLLTAGFSMAVATELYGQLTGMVMPLLYMPMLVVFPVTTVLTPAIADAMAVGNHAVARRQFVKAVGGSLAVGIGTAAACLAFPAAIPGILYDMPDIAPLVRVVGLAAPFAYVGAVFSSVLHALGRTNLLLGNFVVTTVLRLVLIYYLTADPDLGIAGALWAVNADYALTAVLNGWACVRHLRRS